MRSQRQRSLTELIMAIFCGGIISGVVLFLANTLRPEKQTVLIYGGVKRSIDDIETTMSTEEIIYRLERTDTAAPFMTKAREETLTDGAKMVSRQIISIARFEFPRIYGTAFMIGPGVAVTNAHVVGEVPFNTLVEVHCQNGQKQLGYVIESSGIYDLALVRVRCPAVKLNFARHDRFDELLVTGMTYDLNDQPHKFFFRTSIVDETNWNMVANMFVDQSPELYAFYLQAAITNAPNPFIMAGALAAGNSGSPVFRASDGTVVGVFFMYGATFNISYGIPSKSIVELMRKNNISF